MAFNDIPEEMKEYESWVVWKYIDRGGEKPTKIPYSPHTGEPADSTDAATWGTFSQCCELIEKHKELSGIGFVLSPNDPYAFIDLDDCKNDPALVEKQSQIYRDFNSYAELSPSGTGLHIIIKGTIPTGRRKSSIEIYSSERYMTMTGDVYRDCPIIDCNEELNVLYSQMSRKVNVGMAYMGLGEETHTDDEICKMAFNAANGQKFYDLYNGDWDDYYESQSEADFALIDIIAFYSENRAQIVRIFRDSELGKRDKAQRDDYLKYMLDRCFDTMLPPIDVEGLKLQIEKNIKAKEQIEPEHKKKSKTSSKTQIEECSIPLPPGLVGEIAQFIYEQAPRPVPEIALTGALGLMSGICGRAYNVSGMGLNQYILTLGMTGVGKEGCASGIDKLMAQVAKIVPNSASFVGPAEIASSQALTKYMSSTSNSFVSLVGEFGLYMQEMAGQNAPPHLKSLKRLMLDLYNKTGENKVLKQTIYSDKDKNTNSILSPSFTLIGESTPERFYQGLNEGLISDGLLPRFTIIEYKGKRPRRNKHHETVKPSFDLIDKMAALCSQCLNLNNQNKPTVVGMTKEAEEFFDKFDELCDDKINSGDAEVARQLWNRGHVKALKLAALIAVGCNYINPSISLDVAKWATDVTVNEINNIMFKFSNGEVGSDNDEVKQIEKIQNVVRDYVKSSWVDANKYLADSFVNQHRDKIIPYAYIQKRCASLQLFKNDRLGSSTAIKRALRTMCERGDVQEMSKSVLGRDYNSSALSFAISNTKLLS